MNLSLSPSVNLIRTQIEDLLKQLESVDIANVRQEINNFMGIFKTFKSLAVVSEKFMTLADLENKNKQLLDSANALAVALEEERDSKRKDIDKEMAKLQSSLKGKMTELKNLEGKIQLQENNLAEAITKYESLVVEHNNNLNALQEEFVTKKNELNGKLAEVENQITTAEDRLVKAKQEMTKIISKLA